MNKLRIVHPWIRSPSKDIYCPDRAVNPCIVDEGVGHRGAPSAPPMQVPPTKTWGTVLRPEISNSAACTAANPSAFQDKGANSGSANNPINRRSFIRGFKSTQVTQIRRTGNNWSSGEDGLRCGCGQTKMESYGKFWSGGCNEGYGKRACTSSPSWISSSSTILASTSSFAKSAFTCKKACQRSQIGP